jgi:hypothetical protein
MKKRLLFGALLLLSAIGFAQTINDPFFDKVNYRGAFGTTDWTAGWANFDPQNTVYPASQHTLPIGNYTTNVALGSPAKAPASFTNAALTNSFFTPVDYIGAFGQTDWTAGWANFDPQNTNYPTTTVTIPNGNITTNTTWTKNNVYLLNGWVYVKDGATLTIEAGTIIRAEKDVNGGALIIEKGAKLIANGTVTEPIVFTSNKAIGSRNKGDWGGIIICGKAVTNKVSAAIEGGVGSTYGGSDDTDNSGSLKYMRIEYSGIAFSTDNEINGLTMGAVGSGTTIDYIQVSYNGDDSFEWFGGTVNAKHLIAYRGFDDDFDTDAGYRGMVQFAVSLRDPALFDVSESNSFESDNDKNNPTTKLPLTAPVFSNVSSFGPKEFLSTSVDPLYQNAMHLRRGTNIKIFNSVFAGWPNGLKIDGTASADLANSAGNLTVENTVFAGMTNNFVVPSGQTPFTAAAESTWFNTGKNNATYTDNSSLMVFSPFTLTAPNFLPKTTSMLKSLSYWWNSVGTYANNMPIVAKAYVNGSQLTAAGSRLTATKNGVVRGRATIGGDNLFSLSVGSNSTTESDLDLELYDASTQNTYSLPTTFNFNSASSFGTVGSPVELQATASLTIPVNAGYSWISFNVLPEDNSLKNVMNYSKTDEDVIFTQLDNSTYFDGEWYGFTNLEKGKMYNLFTQTGTPGSITITNQPLVKNTPINIQAGYNWIGYPLINSNSVSQALAGISLSNEDVIFNQVENATYFDGLWYDDIVLNPGKGYILSSSVSSEYSFPTNQMGTAVKAPAFVQAKSAAPTTWIQPTNMAKAVILYAQVYKDDVLYQPDGLYLSIFKDNVCYGAKNVFTNGPKGVLYTMNFANNKDSEDAFSLNIYDPTTDRYYTSDKTIDFRNGVNIGSLTNPFKITISSTSVKNTLKASNFSVYPNPVNDVFQLTLNSDLTVNAKIDLYDLQGKLVQSIFNGVVNNNLVKVNRDKSISKGMYMLKATVGNKQYNTKVILN